MLEVVVTPRAAAQLARAASWWAANRPAAPGAIVDDFEAATRLLARQPGVGTPAASTRHAGLRRPFLARTGYHVYYRVSADKLIVLAFWHASRASGPKV